jgi:uncharacterized protein (DUF2336 family)
VGLCPGALWPALLRQPAGSARGIGSKHLFTVPASLLLSLNAAGTNRMLPTVPLIEELEAALSSGDGTRRIEMLTRISDLFVDGASRYSQEQIELFDQVLARLADTIDAKARARLAHRLAPIANAPSNVIHQLAFDDDIEVARPVLRQSERLTEAALRANAGSKSQKHLFAISGRRALSESVTDVLVERGDREIVHSVVTNAGARFSDDGFRILVKRSAADDDLATSAGQRSDIPRRYFLLLLENASGAVRARLAAESPQASAVEGALAEAAGNISGDARAASPQLAAAKAEVERQNRIGHIGDAEIYRYVRDGKFEETVIALSHLCDAPIDFVERALLDPGAEIVLILARVAGLSLTTTKALLSLRAADRGRSAKDVDQALASSNRLQAETARRVLGFFRTRMKKPVARALPPAVALDLQSAGQS